MGKILVIAPYIGLKDLVLDVNKELKRDIDVHVGNLYEGLAIAKSLEHRGYDAIISRGATAKLLKQHFSIPVMDIQLTGYDILRTLTLLNGHSGKIGMMSYMNVIQGADIIGKLLDMDITFYPLHEEKEIEEKVELASKEGIQIIIGDVISTTIASRFGMQTILIASGKEAIIDTILDTERLIYFIRKQKGHLSDIQKIFDHVEEGVFIFNSNHVCTFANQTAKGYFHHVEEMKVFRLENLTGIFPNLEEFFIASPLEAKKEIFVEMKGETYNWRKVPVSEKPNSGFALLFKKQEELQTVAAQNRMAGFHFTSLVSRSEKMSNLIQVAKKVSRSKLPIIVYGEPGAGKESLAQAIHNNSERKNGPYLFVNCEAYSETQLEQELFGSERGGIKRGVLESVNGGTLFIDAIGAMPLGLQGKLLHVVTSGFMSRLNGTRKFPVDIRFIAANREPLDSYVEKGTFREDLYYALNGFILKVPPLRERMDDIDDLVRIFIASANMLTGKQISGLREEVMKELRQFPWPGNIQQLKYVIEQMCLMGEGPFIEKKEVQVLLKEIKEEQQQNEQSGLFQLTDKTLEEIEQEVIMAVLKQEDFNQSKTAKRLGINRSTLWRKIKDLSI